jgi:hypothetical protein
MRYDSYDRAIICARHPKHEAWSNLCGETEVDKPDLASTRGSHP